MFIVLAFYRLARGNHQLKAGFTHTASGPYTTPKRVTNRRRHTKQCNGFIAGWKP